MEALIPRPDIELHVCIPYDRGALVSRMHTHGEVLAEEHTGEGTLLHVRVAPALAAELQPYLQR
jgi:GTP-binding protein HflX